MDGNTILLFIFWIANNAFMYRIGYAYAFKEATKIIVEEVEKHEFVEPDQDAVYWRKMYEEEVNAPRKTP